ncbi:hypothetical protein ACWG0P_05310 [Amedibacillus sp. YH-ame6]
MSDYEAAVTLIKKQNEQYLKEFKAFLKSKDFVDKTVCKHVDNVDFYINDYLCYYEPQNMSCGCHCLSGFLGDWFIRKAMWSSCEAIKSNCASLKKFYKLMLDKGYIALDDYAMLEFTIQEEKESWLAAMDKYVNLCEESLYD